MNTAKFLPKALAASILGLVVCPFAFIAIGALGGFSLAFSVLTLPSLLTSSSYLLYRFLSPPRATSSGLWHVLAQTLSWMVIITFLFIISGFTLLTTAERFGLFSSLYLVCSLLSLPIFIKRNNALNVALQALPQRVTQLLLLIILPTALATSLFYLLGNAKFL